MVHCSIKIPAFRLLTALLFVVGFLSPTLAQQSERRIALVIGNSSYSAGPLPASANDAGLVAQTLQAAGFDVVGARDLDGESLRRALRDFIDKANQSGPDTVAAVYYAGYGLQFDGENYMVPVDARITGAGDVPIQAVRISDFLRPLAAQQLKARIIILDAARENPFARSGPPLAGGLALADVDPGTLVAFNAAPGTVAPASPDSYGPYARALAEMIRQGGLSLNDVFGQVRLRVSETTNGAMVPWDVDRVDAQFLFFERAPEAPPPNAQPNLTALRDQPLRELDVQQAYEAAIERDTIQGYQDFISAYPRDPLSRRVRALLAARREALTWRRTWQDGTPRAFWSYLRRYPHGPHSADAERRLNRLAAALAPPRQFEVIDYDVPPPPPEEIIYFERPVLMFSDPSYDLPPPPRFRYLEPIPTYFVELPPPPPPAEMFVLPQPIYEPVPAWIDRPAYVAPPPVNLISYNIHNTVVVNNVTNTVVVTNPAGQTVQPLAGAAAAGVVPEAALSVAPSSGPTEGVPVVARGANGAAASSSTISPGMAAGVGAVVGAGAAAAAMRIALPPSVAAKAPPAPVQPATVAPATPGLAPAGTALPNASGILPKPGTVPVQAPATPAGVKPSPSGVPPLVPQPGTPASVPGLNVPPAPTVPSVAPGSAAGPVPAGPSANGAKPAAPTPSVAPVQGRQANTPGEKALPVPGITAPPAPGPLPKPPLNPALSKQPASAPVAPVSSTLAPKPTTAPALPGASVTEPQSKSLAVPTSPALNEPMAKPAANAAAPPTPSVTAPTGRLPQNPTARQVPPTPSGEPAKPVASPPPLTPASTIPPGPATPLTPPPAAQLPAVRLPRSAPPSDVNAPFAAPPVHVAPAQPAAPLGVRAPAFPPQSPVVHAAPPPPPPPVVHAAPPPPSPPPVVHAAPPAPVVHAVPPPPAPPVVHLAPPPSPPPVVHAPPPAPVVHAAPPPPPPPVVHAAPPPPPSVVRAPPPPTMQAPPSAAQPPHPAAPARPACGGAGQAACPK